MKAFASALYGGALLVFTSCASASVPKEPYAESLVFGETFEQSVYGWGVYPDAPLLTPVRVERTRPSYKDREQNLAREFVNECETQRAGKIKSGGFDKVRYAQFAIHDYGNLSEYIPETKGKNIDSRHINVYYCENPNDTAPGYLAIFSHAGNPQYPPSAPVGAVFLDEQQYQEFAKFYGNLDRLSEDATSARHTARREKRKAEVDAWRKNLEIGDQTYQGMIVEFNDPLVLVQSCRTRDRSEGSA